MAGRESAVVAWPGAGRIANPADVQRALQSVHVGAANRGSTTAMLQPIATASAPPIGGLAGFVRAHPLIVPVLPWSGGIRRGSQVAAVGSASLALMLIAGAMTDGAYTAVVGWPHLGMVAASEHGADLARVALVPTPGLDWPAVAGALLEGFELVVVAVPGHVGATTANGLTARARRSGAVLVTCSPWPGCDLVLTAGAPVWRGLAGGYGRLRSAVMTVTARGRGAAARTKTVTFEVPRPWNVLDRPLTVRRLPSAGMREAASADVASPQVVAPAR